MNELLSSLPVFDGQRGRLRLGTEVALIEFFNPENGCFDQVSEAELTTMLDMLDGMAPLRVLVLTGGIPGVFVRHYDLRTLQVIAEKLHHKGIRFSTDRPVPEASFPRLVRRLAEARFVTIAAINGVAMGGGLELALGCDIRIAQEGDYPIGLPELSVGILPGAGGTQRMPQILGAGRTLYNLLTGRMYSPAEAQQAGLVDECVPDALQRALAIARHVTGLPAKACAHAKFLVRNVGNVTHADGMANERTLMCDCLVDPASMARVKATLDNGAGIETLSFDSC
jgi:enoyl-CoA hydratase/carnithine racemase